MRCGNCQRDRNPVDLNQEIMGRYLNRKGKWKKLIVTYCREGCESRVPVDLSQDFPDIPIAEEDA